MLAIHNVSQSYGPPRPVIGIALPLFYQVKEDEIGRASSMHGGEEEGL
jgi:hypothetical protein